MRHKNEIMNLPMSELTDEEIAKAAMYRLNTKSLMFIYVDEESDRMIFLTRWKNSDGRRVVTLIKKAIEEYFGKIKPVK